MRALLLVPAALTLLAGCSSGKAGDPSAEGGSPAAGASSPAVARSTAPTGTGSPVPTSGTVCAKDARGRGTVVPAGFPADFPLPPGMIVTSAQDRGAAGIVLTGVTDQPFPATLDALHKQLPAHGYTAENGESEPDDAESDWTSAKFEGRWAIREAPGCDDDTTVQILARAK